MFSIVSIKHLGRVAMRTETILVFCVYGFAGLLLLVKQRQLLRDGGGLYQHADWLINFSSGIVRRGMSGETVLWISDLLSTSPLMVVAAMQLLATFVIMVALLVKGVSLGMPDRVALLLLSPALVIFWANDTGGAFRKELLGYLAFVPLLVPARRPLPVSVSLVLTILGFSMAVLWHEVNAFLAPLLALAIIARFGTVFARANLWLVAGIPLLLGAGGVLFAKIYATLSSTDAMCNRLLEKGLTPALCDGIFTWLSSSVSRNTSETAELLTSVSVLTVAFIYLACVGVTLWLIAGFFSTRRALLVALLASLPMPLLFFVAVDWGRWLSMQVFGLTFLGLIHAERFYDRTSDVPELPKRALAAILAFCLGLGVLHVGLYPTDGFLRMSLTFLSTRLP